MTEKRFVTIENGIDYGVIDTLTGERIFDEDITTKLNEIYVKVKESYNFGVDTKAKHLYTKTTVDDIIGIVKTEEQTNSVEEVRKLRGRENKTAKRFTLKAYDGITCDVFDKDIEIANVHRDDAKGLVELLNRLHEENQKKQKLLHLSANKIENLLEENIQLKKEVENLKQGMIHAAFDKEWK